MIRRCSAAFEGIAPDNHLIHGFKGGKTNEVSQVDSTEDMGRADQVLADFTIRKSRNSRPRATSRSSSSTVS